MNDKAILLKLPKVSIGCEENTVNRLPSDENISGFLPFELDDEDQNDSFVDEDVFCQPNLTKGSGKFSNELHDLYLFLQQLSPPVPVQSSSRKANQKGKMEGEVRGRSKGGGDGSPNSFGSLDANRFDHVKLKTSEDNAHSGKAVAKREEVKMTSINLFESILPSSLFVNSRSIRK